MFVSIEWLDNGYVVRCDETGEELIFAEYVEVIDWLSATIKEAPDER